MFEHVNDEPQVAAQEKPGLLHRNLQRHRGKIGICRILWYLVTVRREGAGWICR